MNKHVLLATFATTISFQSLALELPDIPFPAPGSDEILFVVRDVTDSVHVEVDDFWSNRTVKRVPFSSVRKQSIMSTGGEKWLSAFMTVSVNGTDYTMGAISGYKNFSSVVYTNISKGSVDKDFSSVSRFVGEQTSTPNYTVIDETPDYFVSSETFDSGSGTVVVLCISDRTTLSDCLTQH